MKRNELFTLLMDSMKHNLSRFPEGYRYSNELKLFCVFVRILGGKIVYETLKANLFSSIPSLRSVDTYIKNNRANIHEGICLGISNG